MMRLDVVVRFVADQLFDGLFAVLRHGTVDQLIENRHHLIPSQGATFQEDLADRQYLAAVQMFILKRNQTVSVFFRLVSDFRGRHLTREIVAKFLNIPLLRSFTPKRAAASALLIPPPQASISYIANSRILLLVSKRSLLSPLL